jgi:molybdopterin synthase catalytic subunit
MEVEPMPAPTCSVLLTEKPLPIHMPLFPDDGEAGALVDFYGIVRQRENDAPIQALKYEAYAAMAQDQLQRILTRLSQKYGVLNVQLAHRTGIVPAGEPSLHVRIRSVHRQEAFNLAEAIICELKQNVPIWKTARSGRLSGGA